MRMTFNLALAIAVLTGFSGLAMAQERAASGVIETQMTWSALSSQIQSANVKIDGVNSRVDQAVICGKQGKIYAPEANGADAHGCLEASSNNGTTLTNIINANTTTANNIASCGASGYVWNGSGCVAPKSSSCTLQESGPSGRYHNSSTDSMGSCNGGSIAVGTGGAAIKCLKVVCN